MAEEFVLDLAANPHPRMLAGALKAQRKSRTGGIRSRAYWNGYLLAMCDATGLSPAVILEWLASHEAAS